MYSVTDEFLSRVSADLNFGPTHFSSASMDHLYFWLHHLYPQFPPEQLPNFTKSFAVRCITVQDLLKELQLTPDALDYLVVDAEGYDVEIVNQFLSLAAFMP